MLLLLLGCAGFEHQAADLQWDIEAEMPADASTLRLCVIGVGQRVVGAREDGRMSFLAIPTGAPVDLGLDVLDDAGDLLAQTQAAQVSGYTRSALSLCGDSAEACAPCSAEGDLADEDQPSWTLAVRFVHEAS